MLVVKLLTLTILSLAPLSAAQAPAMAVPLYGSACPDERGEATAIVVKSEAAFGPSALLLP